MTPTSRIICPHCNNEIDIEELLAHDIEERVRSEQRKIFEAERELLLLQEKERVERETSAVIETLRRENEERRKEADGLRKLEVEHLQLQRALQEQKDTFDLALQKKLLEQQSATEAAIKKAEAERYSIERRREEERFDLEKRELLKKLEDTQKIAEDLRRKTEQTSQQLQGEVQELAIEEFLRHRFPLDVVTPVAKGVRGADCVLAVREMGRECGTIMIESKRTKHWTAEWIDKLKHNMREQGADLGVIVTDVLPKDVTSFTQISGVWVCTVAEFRSLIGVLREMIVKISAATASQENKGDKMHMLYDYLMSSAFRMAVENVMDSFMQMRSDIQRERTAMEKIWRQREKQLERMSLSMSAVMGSITGIAGKDLGPVPLFELPEPDADTPVT